MKQTILIIDDEIADVLAAGLKGGSGADDLVFRTAADGATGLRLANEINPALILLDIGLPTLDGFTVLSELQKSNVQTRIIMMSGYKTDLTTAIKCVKAGACDYIVKGQLPPAQILERVRRALILESTLNVQVSHLPATAKSLIEEAARLKDDYERIKNENRALQKKVAEENYHFILLTIQKVIAVILAAGCVLLLKWADVVQATLVLPIVFVFLVVLLLIPADKIRTISASVQRIFSTTIHLHDDDERKQ